MQHTITITKTVKTTPHAENITFTEISFLVEVELANGYTAQPQPCDNEEQARVYARGLADGFSLAKNAIDIGLRYDGTITEKPVT